MKKIISVLMVLGILLIGCKAFCFNESKNEKVLARIDTSLLKELTRYVDQDQIAVDQISLKKNFFPVLDLEPKDRVLKANFGSNHRGRFFSMMIRKASRTGETIGLFSVVFYTERRTMVKRDSALAYLVFFHAKDGNIYGKIPDDYTGIISIYEIGTGSYLVNDQLGRVISCRNLSNRLRWSPKHTTGNLINAGKTIGYILEEYLDALEKAGIGGRGYENKALWRYQESEKMCSKYRYQIFFDK